MLFYPLDAVDGLLFFLSAWIRVSVWGFVLGAVTMLLYDKLSPQDKIAELKEEVSEAQKRLHNYRGDEFSELLSRMKTALDASLRQMKVMFLPTMIAAGPVIVVLLWMPTAYSGELISFGPAWLRSWYVIFLTTLSISAVLTKYLFDIE
jgi:uncharacterized membrane protein (DUF106 family)